MDAYEKLANAIVLSAVADYRTALKSLARNPDGKCASTDAESLERFFRSGWYSVLTGVDGEMLIRKLREEAGL